MVRKVEENNDTQVVRPPIFVCFILKLNPKLNPMCLREVEWWSQQWAGGVDSDERKSVVDRVVLLSHRKRNRTFAQNCLANCLRRYSPLSWKYVECRTKLLWMKTPGQKPPGQNPPDKNPNFESNKIALTNPQYKISRITFNKSINPTSWLNLAKTTVNFHQSSFHLQYYFLTYAA